MFERLENTLVAWNRRTSDRQKLQHSYIALLIITVFMAGIVSLFNSSRSEVLFYVGLILATSLLANFLVWTVLKATVLDQLPRQSRQTQTRRASRR